MGCEPWLAIVYDRLARKQWSERSLVNEAGFDIESECLTLNKDLLSDAEAEFKR